MFRLLAFQQSSIQVLGVPDDSDVNSEQSRCRQVRNRKTGRSRLFFFKKKGAACGGTRKSATLVVHVRGTR